LLIANSLALTS